MMARPKSRGHGQHTSDGKHAVPNSFHLVARPKPKPKCLCKRGEERRNGANNTRYNRQSNMVFFVGFCTYYL